MPSFFYVTTSITSQPIPPPEPPAVSVFMDVHTEKSGAIRKPLIRQAEHLSLN